MFAGGMTKLMPNSVAGRRPVLLIDFARASTLSNAVVRGDEPITFTRSSTVNGWTEDANGDPILTEFSVDKPAFVIDPATGQKLGYRALAGFTNSLLWNRDLSNGSWALANGVTVSQDAVGLDGASNSAWTFTDDDSTNEYPTQSISVPDDSNPNAAVFYIGKNSGNEPDSFPAVQVNLEGGTTTTSLRYTVDTRDGTVADMGTTGTHSIQVYDVGVFWKIVCVVTNNGSGNTNLIYRPHPAATTTAGGSFENAATGSVVYDFGGVYLNSSIPGPPIETEGSPVSTDAGDGTESVPTGLQSAGTLVISARTANGVSGDQVLAQMDDGTENNRVRIVRNDSREVRYIVTDGGTEVANLNLGTVSDDTDTKVAIRYGTDDYAGIISGGTLQTDTTGTMPSISTLRHGRDTADGDEWNGTIADVRGDDAYTDAQLEGAV